MAWQQSDWTAFYGVANDNLPGPSWSTTRSKIYAALRDYEDDAAYPDRVTAVRSVIALQSLTGLDAALVDGVACALTVPPADPAALDP